MNLDNLRIFQFSICRRKTWFIHKKSDILIWQVFAEATNNVKYLRLLRKARYKDRKQWLNLNIKNTRRRQTGQKIVFIRNHCNKMCRNAQLTNLSKMVTRLGSENFWNHWIPTSYILMELQKMLTLIHWITFFCFLQLRRNCDAYLSFFSAAR